MDRNREASLGCIKNEEFPCNLHDSGNSLDGFPEPKVEIHAKPGGILKPASSLYQKNSALPNGGYYWPFYQQEHCIWSAFYPDLQKVQQSQWNSFESQFYPKYREFHFPIENRFQYAPMKMFSPGYSHDFQFQEFQYFVVIDFEATCDKEKNPHPQEIIEFPSVVVNSVTGQLECALQIYVKPTYHQLLTDFCKELTGIQQIQVDRGVLLDEALLIHDKWLEDKGIKHTNFAVVTWSNWDCRVMLESECRFKRIRKPPYFNRWINLKVPFQEVFGGVRCNLKEAVKLAGLAWEGRAHCGLDDARNTARLLSHLMRQGFKFSITNSLMWQSADSPLAGQRYPDCPSPMLQPQKPKQLVGPTSQFHPLSDPNFKERCMYCLCGVMSSKRMVRKPGPGHGRWFFGCGNWTITRGALCPYFEWAT